jgi:hypothetical protein
MDVEVLTGDFKNKNYMHKLINSISVVLIMVFLNSCTKDADVKLPQVESKLVINSFISPQDTVIKVGVTLSQPLYNNSNSGQIFDVNNAVVQISDGVNTKTLNFDPAGNYYSISTAQFQISVGVTYNLTVSTPDGKYVTATTSIPEPNSTLTYTSRYLNDPNETDAYSINAYWNDTPGSEDYYRVLYFNKYIYFGDIDTTYSFLFSENYSDKNNDGKVLSDNFEVNKMNNSSGEIYLMHATKEYYLYHKALRIAPNSGNPFSEPVQMYSNVKGGYGIFAGFNQYKLEVFL